MQAPHQPPATKPVIHPDLRAADLASAFQRFGRLHVPGFLTEASAGALHRLLAEETLWVCSTIGGGVVAEIPVELLVAMPPAQQARLVELAHGEACHGFHYMFDSLRISDVLDRGEALAPAYQAVVDFLNGAAFLDFVRALTGDLRPTYVDAQATRFEAGHYLTRHDDHKPTASRLYAYVLNLTPQWRADWGGLLNFYDTDGHVAEAYAPAWNALNIFRVPQPHAVSFVAPFAGGPRLSITGWIRDDRPTPPPLSGNTSDARSPLQGPRRT